MMSNPAHPHALLGEALIRNYLEWPYVCDPPYDLQCCLLSRLDRFVYRVAKSEKHTNWLSQLRGPTSIIKPSELLLSTKINSVQQCHNELMALF